MTPEEILARYRRKDDARPRDRRRCGPTDEYLGRRNERFPLLNAHGRRLLFRLLKWEEYDRRCALCGERVDLNRMHLDHIIQRVDGGPDTWQNLRPAHPWCNVKRARSYRSMHADEDGEPLLTVRQAAQRLGLEVDALRTWIKRGAIRRYRQGLYGHFRVRLDEVADWQAAAVTGADQCASR